MNKTHDYIHRYRGYWSDGGRCRIRIYREVRQIPAVIRSQVPENDNTSITSVAEYLAAEVIEDNSLPTPNHIGWDYRDGRRLTSSMWRLRAERGLSRRTPV